MEEGLWDILMGSQIRFNQLRNGRTLQLKAGRTALVQVCVHRDAAAALFRRINVVFTGIKTVYLHCSWPESPA